MQRVEQVQSYRGFVFATLASNPEPLLTHLGRMTDVIDNLVDRSPDGEIEIADSSFTLEYRGNWKLHPENAADIFHPSFVHSSSVMPARRAPANASILDQDQTREMLLANGFGNEEWESIQLAGLAGGHTFMTSFYKKGVLVGEDSDPVAARYKKALIARHGAEKVAQILGMTRFNNIVYPNLIINAQYQQMRVTIPISVDRTVVRIHCFRLKGAPDEIFHRAVRFLTTYRLARLDDLLRRCRDAGALPARACDGYRPVGRFLARPGQRSSRRGRQRVRCRERNADAGSVPGVGGSHDGGGRVMLDYETQRRIELFLFEEARLLDAGQFEEWLKLYEPHGIYWMPSQPGQTDPLNVASIIYEDHAILSIRVQRLLEARALVLTPMPRTTHLVEQYRGRAIRR